MADYNLQGYKYGPSTTAGSTGGTLTWSIDSTIPAYFVPVLAAAFADWQSYANVQFRQVATGSTADITFTLGYIDGLNGTLGFGGSSYYLRTSGLNQAFSGSVKLDSAENWHHSGSKVVSDGQADLFVTAVHEIGHVLGLGHYNSGPAIMNATQSSSVKDLTTSDIHGIQYLYGAINPANSWDKLVDKNFYKLQYSDVASDGIDPAIHYNSSGWHEGRDPDAFFFTDGYLAANRDVAKAGTNPLAQYDQQGWHEGRDPSANFDNELYLKHNPDVAAAGIDPLAHYLQYGQAEGRQAYAAIGKMGDLRAHPGFDAEYYLLSNPDVAKVSMGAADSFAFAYQHFETYGRHEGRDPNAFFDTDYYLSHNPDVAAAGVDPLAHYDTYGWKEGRDPSAAFHTTAYLHNNPDVAAAHIDPLQHYLQFGALEGRLLV